MAEKSYEVNDRRRAAALAACDGLPTEALERGIIKELYKLAAVLVVADKMAMRINGIVRIPIHLWETDVCCALNRLNDTCEPGHTDKAGLPRHGAGKDSP